MKACSSARSLSAQLDSLDRLLICVFLCKQYIYTWHIRVYTTIQWTIDGNINSCINNCRYWGKRHGEPKNCIDWRQYAILALTLPSISSIFFFGFFHFFLYLLWSASQTVGCSNNLPIVRLYSLSLILHMLLRCPSLDPFFCKVNDMIELAARVIKAAECILNLKWKVDDLPGIICRP